ASPPHPPLLRLAGPSFPAAIPAGGDDSGTDRSANPLPHRLRRRNDRSTYRGQPDEAEDVGAMGDRQPGLAPMAENGLPASGCSLARQSGDPAPLRQARVTLRAFAMFACLADAAGGRQAGPAPRFV